MKETAFGLLIGIIGFILISPYFSLWNLRELNKLNDIKTELEEIKKELRKLNDERLCKRN